MRVVNWEQDWINVGVCERGNENCFGVMPMGARWCARIAQMFVLFEQLMPRPTGSDAATRP